MRPMRPSSGRSFPWPTVCDSRWSPKASKRRSSLRCCVNLAAISIRAFTVARRCRPTKSRTPFDQEPSRPKANSMIPSLRPLTASSPPTSRADGRWSPASRGRDQEMRGQQQRDHSEGEIENHAHVGPISRWNDRGSQRLCNLAKLTGGDQGHDRPEDEENHAESMRKGPLRSAGGLVQNRLQVQSKPLDNEAESHQRNCCALPCQQRAFRGKEHAWITKISVHCWTVLRYGTDAQYGTNAQYRLIGTRRHVSPKTDQ